MKNDNLKFKIILFLIFFLGGFLVWGNAMAADYYIADTAAGSGNGTSCANANALADLTWGTGNMVDAGDTLHLCGTITSTVSIGVSGTEGNLVTIKFEDGAKLSKNYWEYDANYGSTSAIDTGGHDYIVIDGGTNGIIECTENGTALENQEQTNGIYADGSTNLEIKNLTIQNMYVRTSGDDVTPYQFGSMGPTAIRLYYGSSNVSIHDCSFSHAVGGITMISTGTNLTTVSIYNNNFSNIDHNIAIATSTGTISGVSVHDNDFSDYASWDDTISENNKYHHNAAHIYLVGAGTLDGIYIYNNNSSGDYGAFATSQYYIESNSGSGTINDLRIYNNLILEASAASEVWGHIAVGGADGLTVSNSIIANNTIFGQTDGTNTAILLSGGNNNTIIVENNAIIGHNIGIDNTSYADALNVVVDYNLYSGNTYFGVGHNGWEDWKTHIGGESNGVNKETHGLTVLGVPDSGSATVKVGTDLSAIFTTDFLGNTRSGAWDIGAYEYTGADDVVAPASPTGLSVQ